jgi:hypothetical protein
MTQAAPSFRIRRRFPIVLTRVRKNAYAGAQSASSDVYEQLARLSSLRDSGAISQEEYDAKKACCSRRSNN